MFNAETLDFAQEMIADTQRHQAETVGELLAFMRKYRLLFTNADDKIELHTNLYDLLRKQKEALGLKSTGGATVAVSEPGELFERGSVWEGTRTLLVFRQSLIDRLGGNDFP
jgi:hypothetical protein